MFQLRNASMLCFHITGKGARVSVDVPSQVPWNVLNGNQKRKSTLGIIVLCLHVSS